MTEDLKTLDENVSVEHPLDELIELNKEACDSFLVQLTIVEKLDGEVAKIDITRTPASHELGRQAVALKDSLGHGNWMPYLERIKRPQRTITRAMVIFEGFPDKNDLIGMTVVDAEEFARNAIAKRKGLQRKTEENRAAIKKKAENDRLAAEKKRQDAEKLQQKVEVENANAFARAAQADADELQKLNAQLKQELDQVRNELLGQPPSQQSTQPTDHTEVDEDLLEQDADNFFNEEVFLMLQDEDHPSEQEREVFFRYADEVGNVERAFEIAVKMLRYVAEATIRVGGHALVETTAELRELLVGEQTSEQSVQTATSADQPSEKEDAEEQSPEQNVIQNPKPR
jgi:hypothetical protein